MQFSFKPDISLNSQIIMNEKMKIDASIFEKKQFERLYEEATQIKEKRS